jgi:hypothetical protein
MFTLDEDVEGVLVLQRILLERRSDRALCDENSSVLDDDGTRGNSAFDAASLVDPNTPGTFEISRCLAIYDEFIGLDGIGELDMALFFDDH